MTKIRALAETGQWEQLRKFSSGSSIGYVPFAEACVVHGNKQEAVEYTRKVDDLSERALLYARADAWPEAIAIVEKIKDPQDILWKLKAACTNPQALQAIHELLQRRM